MGKAKMLMFKINNISYKKNEDFVEKEDNLMVEQKIYCIFGSYSRKLRVQDTEFRIEIGNKNINPFKIDMSLDAKFIGIDNISRREMEKEILEKRFFDHILPYMRTRILDLSMGAGTSTNNPYDLAYGSTKIEVVRGKGIFSKIRGFLNLGRWFK